MLHKQLHYEFFFGLIYIFPQRDFAIRPKLPVRVFPEAKPSNQRHFGLFSVLGILNGPGGVLRTATHRLVADAGESGFTRSPR